MKPSWLKWNKAGFVILLLGLACMLAGFLTGGASVVLQKAVRVCLECVGIG